MTLYHMLSYNITILQYVDCIYYNTMVQYVELQYYNIYGTCLTDDSASVGGLASKLLTTTPPAPAPRSRVMNGRTGPGINRLKLWQKLETIPRAARPSYA